MKTSIAHLLACPSCRGPLAPGGARRDDELACRDCARTYPVVREVPRFVSPENYASSFGFQWQLHARTQLDSHNGTGISAQRFFRETRWPEDLTGQRVLEVGCGSGRFSEVVLATGASCFSIDYSLAVDACWANCGAHPRLHVFQADLFHLPFRRGLFDRIFCFGVLQHTPEPARAFASLLPYLKEGGSIAVDAYAWPFAYLHPRHLLRPVTRHLPADRLYRSVERWVPRLLPISRALKRLPAIGPAAARLVPVANYEGVLPLSEEQLQEWAVLDTFDWLSPRFEQPQRAGQLRRWLRDGSLCDVEVERLRGLYVGRGRKAG